MGFRTACCAAALATFALALAQLPLNAREDHEYNLQKVKWSVTVHFRQRAISGDVVNTVIPDRDNAKLLFDCANLSVTQVTVNGQAASTAANGHVLLVTPSQAVLKSVPLQVEIHYTGLPEAGIYFVPAARAFPAHTDIVYTQGEMEDNRYWLPTYDDPDDKATFDGTVNVRKGWSVLSNGSLDSVTHAGNRDIWHWTLDKPCSTYLISFVAGPYTAITDGHNPVPVSYWVPKGLERWGKNAFGGTDKIIQFYSKITGVPYAWPKYAQSAVADFMFGGMENVTCTTQTITALHPKRVEPNVDTTGLVAHELAHQWFGDLVTLKDWSHAWLNEGWASFMPCLWTRVKYGENAYDIQRYTTFMGGLFAHRFEPNRPMIWKGYTDPMQMFDSYAYPGGASRLFMLMHMVGEKRFWPAVKDYLSEFRYKNATTRGFFASMSKSLGINLDEFMQQWFYTPAAPDLSVGRSNGQVVITQGKVPFHLPLDIWLIDSDNHIERRHIDLAATPTTVIPNVGNRVVLLDPGVWLMANISYDMNYTSAQLVQMYNDAPNDAGKLRLLDLTLGSLVGPAQVDFAKTIHDPLLLRYAVPSVQDPAFLLEMSHNHDPRIEEVALHGLGRVSSSPDVLARLRDVWDHSKNDVLRGAALQSLASLTNDSSLVEQAYATPSYNDGYKVFALNWWADHEPDKARQLALQALDQQSDEPVRITAIGVLGLVKDLPGQKTVYNTLISFMTERSNSPLRAAIRALGNYGDKAAIPVLETRANHGLHFVRDDVAAAVAQLSGGAPTRRRRRG